MYIVALLIIGSLTSIQAYESLPMTTGFISPSIYSKKKPKSREEAIQMMQAFYIKKVLTEPIFTKLDIFNDDDIDFIDSSQNDMINDLIAEQMAKKLAEQDLLNFKKRFLPNYNNKKIMTNRTGLE